MASAVHSSGWLLRGLLLRGVARDDDLSRFAAWSADLEFKNDEAEKIVLLELEARLRRLALSFDVSAQGRLGGGEAGHVEKMAAFVAQHFAEPLQIADIAQHCNLHPGYAMTTFKRGFGMSLGEFVT